MPIYMKYGAISGGVTARGYRSWIELESAQYGSSGGSRGFGSYGASNVSDIVVTKRSDVASNALYRECIQGNAVTAFIDFVKGGSVYLRLKLHEAMISSFSYSGYGNDVVESLTINFAKVEFVPTPGVPAR